MFGARILTRIYVSLIFTIIATAFVIDLAVERDIISNTLPEERQSMEEKARLILPRLERALEEGGEERFIRTLRLVGEESQLTVTFYSLSGEVTFDSASTTEHFDTSPERPEVAQLLKEGETYLIRHSPKHASRTMFIGKTLTRNGLNYGYVRFARPLHRMEERLLDVRGSIVFGAALMVLLAFVPGALFAAQFTRPVSRIRKSIKSFAEGERPALRTTREDEIGTLIRDLQDHYALVEERLALLQAQRSRLASILGGMVEGVIAIDENELVFYINSFAAAILGSDRTHSEGKPLWEMSRRASISQAILAALGRESASTSEARLVDERGDRFIKIYTSAIFNEDGHPAGAVVVLQDVTALRKLADFRQDMITNVSHEFKTPLTAIMGITETLIENPSLDTEKRQSFLQRIMNQADRLRILATDVLELSRVENRESAALHTPQDIRAIVRNAHEVLAPRAARKQLEMRYDENAEPIVVNCEEQSILQISENLLDNAIKYTQEGGAIWLRVDRDRNQAVIEVRDNGPGIETSECDRIFERFYRTRAARTPRTKGTGLGLAIVQSIVLSYEGDIVVDSKPGIGSTFTVRLPLYRAGN